MISICCVGLASLDVVFQHAREECESKMMFSLSGPCELLFFIILMPLGPELL